jgi:hypothetical protein
VTFGYLSILYVRVCEINDPGHTCDEYLILLTKLGMTREHRRWTGEADRPLHVNHRGGRWWCTWEVGSGTLRICLAVHLGGGVERTCVKAHLSRWRLWLGAGSGEDSGTWESLETRGVTFWVIGFLMYSPRASNVRLGNAVENVRHLGGLLRFWPKRRKKAKPNRELLV